MGNNYLKPFYLIFYHFSRFIIKFPIVGLIVFLSLYFVFAGVMSDFFEVLMKRIGKEEINSSSYRVLFKTFLGLTYFSSMLPLIPKGRLLA